MFQYKEVKNPIFKYVVLGIGIAFILGILWFLKAFSEAFDIGKGVSHYNIISSTASPIENYVATSYVVMGGGAAGWCYKLVKIGKQNEPFENSEEILKARCSNEMEVTWTNDNNLNIAYSEEPLYESKTEWNDVKILYSLDQNQ